MSISHAEALPGSAVTQKAEALTRFNSVITKLNQPPEIVTLPRRHRVRSLDLLKSRRAAYRREHDEALGEIAGMLEDGLLFEFKVGKAGLVVQEVVSGKPAPETTQSLLPGSSFIINTVIEHPEALFHNGLIGNETYVASDNELSAKVLDEGAQVNVFHTDPVHA